MAWRVARYLGSELGPHYTVSRGVHDSRAGNCRAHGGGRAGADGAGDDITHAEGAERRAEAAAGASSAAEAAVPSSLCSSRAPMVMSLLKSEVCDVLSPVPDCRVVYNSQPPRKLCTRTPHHWLCCSLPLTRVVGGWWMLQVHPPPLPPPTARRLIRYHHPQRVRPAVPSIAHLPAR
jgi:hypothetical protein